MCACLCDYSGALESGARAYFEESGVGVGRKKFEESGVAEEKNLRSRESESEEKHLRSLSR